MEQGKDVLYLVNRKNLYDQIKDRIRDYPNATLMTYQALQSKIIRNGDTMPHYDYIVADECHYFLSDGVFNNYTDISYNWLLNQQDNVIIYISATGNHLFSGLVLVGKVKPNRIYTIANNYSQVDAVYFYKKNQTTKIIDKIMHDNPNDKIIVYVNSIKRLKEMHCIYDDKASYLCSQARKKEESINFVDYECVQDCTFKKRILFVTKALDNGIDIKDKDIKHIFCEISDVDSAIQAIGRKRPISDDDTYSIYFLHYGNRAIRQFARILESELLPVEQLLLDKKAFIKKYGKDRELLRKNKILYPEMTDNDDVGTIHINHVMRQKYERDVAIYNRMIQDGFKEVFLNLLPHPLRPKVKELKVDKAEKDLFLQFLKSVSGQKLFKDEQKILKEKFKIMLGLNDRGMGLHTLNGKLKDCGYQYQIISQQETKGEYRKQRYWMIVPKYYSLSVIYKVGYDCQSGRWIISSR